MVDKISIDKAVDELSGQADDQPDDEPMVELDVADDEQPELEPTEEQPVDQEGEDQGDDPYNQLVTVKVDGRDEQVTLKEALDGYIRTRTFHQRMSEADVARKHAETAINEMGYHRKHYLDSIEVVKQLIRQKGLDEPKREDYDDPVAYLEAKAEVETRKSQLQQLSMVQADEIQQAQAEAMERLRVQAVRETKIFYEHPAMHGQWKDYKSFKASTEKTKQWAQERLGYSKQELASIYDHRAAIAMTYARLYFEAMERANNRVREKAAGAAPFTIRGNASVAQQRRGPMNGAQRAKVAFDKAPSIDSAVDMIVARRTTH